jgi:UDP:flavonoid glycosyltransferase YjiC (YdhE family)
LRIAVCTTGTSGDHRPYVAIAAELHRRGHDVQLIVHPSYAKTLSHVPDHMHLVGTVAPDSLLVSRPELLDPRTGFFAIMRQMLLPEAVPHFNELERLQALGAFDVLLAHHIAYGAIWWAERRRVPLAIGYLSPFATLCADGDGTMAAGSTSRKPVLVAKALRFAAKLLFRHELDGVMNETRAAFGLPAQRDVFVRLLESRNGHLGLWDEAMRSPAPGDPPGLVTCGFPFLAAEAPVPLAPEIADFLATEPRPIVCALGTTGGQLPVPLADLVAEACELAGRPALLIGDRPPTSTRSSRWFAFAPHTPVFAKADLVVHHAGMGTLAEVLRAGKVSLVLPLANDQFDNGVRLRNRGVAAVVDPRKASAAKIARAIRRLLADRAAASTAERIGERVRAANGARRAAEALVARAWLGSQAASR